MNWPTHGTNPHYLYKAAGIRQPAQIYDFSANINPLGPPKSLREDWDDFFQEIIYYPDPKATSLRTRLAEQEGLHKDQVIIGNGGAEIISLIGKWLTGKRVMIIEPSFSEYEQTCRVNECSISYFFIDHNGKIDVPHLSEALTDQDALFLCNPNNPTGIYFEKQVIEQILTICSEKKCYLIVDEAFYDFVDAYQSLVPLLNQFPNLILIRSMTKMYAIPGVRLGYMMADAEIVQSLQNQQSHWSVNGIALKAGERCLDEKHYVEQTRLFVRKERERLFRNFRKHRFDFLPSAVNFYLLRDPSMEDQSTFFQFLLKEGIVPRHTYNFPGIEGKWLRFAIRSEKENDILLEVMEKWRAIHQSSL